MKVLLIGHRGQLGCDLRNVFAVEDLVLSTQQEMNVRDPEQVQSMLECHQPDLILNCAAFHRVDDCEA